MSVATKVYIMSLIDKAAESGDLELLISLREQGHEWTTQTSAYAAGAGHLDCLRYLRENGCQWDVHAANHAAACGQLDCLQYLYENGCEWDKWATRWAALHGHLNCLRYLHVHGCECDEYTCTWAAKYGHLECLKYLHKNGCLWNDEMATEWAAQNGHFDCLQYLYENGCPLELPDTLSGLSKHIDKLDFDQHSWLREFLFPHVNSEDMPEKLKEKCKAKMAQIALEKQAVEDELSCKLSVDVIKHCLCVFI